MLSSLDGKISTGSSNKRDVDQDFPKIDNIKQGLQQYYNLEQTTDLHSLNSGKVLAKIGANKPQKNLQKLPVSFLIIDNKPHLNKTGVKNYLQKSKKLYIITTNKNHPAFELKNQKNIEIIHYNKQINFVNLFKRLKREYQINKLTVQTGGTLNAILLRKELIDKISLVIAPALIGGKDTPSLIDGKSLASLKDLQKIKALKLTSVKQLQNSYLHLKYSIINQTKVI